MKMITQLTGGLVLVIAVPAQQPSRPPNIVLSNDRLELTIQATGGTLAKILLRDVEPLSPLATMGHFLALDGFGAPSEHERAAGVPFHGEASKQAVKVISSQTSGPARSIAFEIAMPLAQETLTRTVDMVDGENIAYVTSDLQSGLAADRPISWAEHATLGEPFLERGKTVVDMPALNCRVRPFKPGGIPGRLAYRSRIPMANGANQGQCAGRLAPGA